MSFTNRVTAVCADLLDQLEDATPVMAELIWRAIAAAQAATEPFVGIMVSYDPDAPSRVVNDRADLHLLATVGAGMVGYFYFALGAAT